MFYDGLAIRHGDSRVGYVTEPEGNIDSESPMGQRVARSSFWGFFQARVWAGLGQVVWWLIMFAQNTMLVIPKADDHSLGMPFYII